MATFVALSDEGELIIKRDFYEIIKANFDYSIFMKKNKKTISEWFVYAFFDENTPFEDIINYL